MHLRFLLRKFLLLISIIPFMSQAQQVCLSDSIHKAMMRSDTAYRSRMLEFEENLHKYPHTLANGVFRVPVVVHVMHLGEEVGTGTNISDAQIRLAIKGLNERFRKVTGGIGDGEGQDIGIEFSLAVRTPEGKVSNGINRVNMSSFPLYVKNGVDPSAIPSGMPDFDLFAFSSWNSSNYYNIFVVSSIPGATAGFAYLPGYYGLQQDGTIIEYPFMNREETTLTHELGHAMSLYHTFDEVTNGCPVNNDCHKDGDRCCDTPPHKGQGCSAAENTICQPGFTGLGVEKNYMNYSSSNCQQIFTPDQKILMVETMTSVRKKYSEASGNNSLKPAGLPLVDFGFEPMYKTEFVKAGSSVQFYDFSTGIPNTYIPGDGWGNITFNWSFRNMKDNMVITSNLQNPVIVAKEGYYNVTLSITTPYGTATKTKNAMFFAKPTDVYPKAITCTPASSSGTSYYTGIYEVQLDNLQHFSQSSYDDFTDKYTKTGRYQNLTATHGTELLPGKSYTLKVKGSTDATVTEYFKVYIDYNGDGDFADAGETVAAWDAVAGSVNYLKKTITIPAGSTRNPTTMRVMSSISAIPSSCTNPVNGEIYDYLIKVSDMECSGNVSASSATISYGTSVVFTAVPNPGWTGSGKIGFQWKLNGKPATGEISSTFVSNSLLNGDEVSCDFSFADSTGLKVAGGSPCEGNIIKMKVTGKPVADFSIDRSLICMSGAIRFTDLSANTPTTWTWTVQGPDTLTSAIANPVFTFTTAGVYSVTLKAGNTSGYTSKTFTDTITVLKSPAASCLPKITYNNEYSISYISFKEKTYSFLNTTATYFDNTCSELTTFEQGKSYRFYLGLRTSNGKFTVFIDFNADGDFDDTGEKVLANTSGNYENLSDFSKNSVLIPYGAKTGEILRMRVVLSSNQTLACPLSAVGQVFDFGVIINPVCTPPTEAFNFVRATDTVTPGKKNVYYELPQYAGLAEWSYSGQGALIKGSGKSVTVDYSYADATSGELSATLKICGETRTAKTFVKVDRVITSTNILAAPQTINLYPNPVTGEKYLKLDVPFDSDVKLSVIPVNGGDPINFTGFQQSEPGEYELKLPENMASGMYLLYMQTEQETMVGKFVKQ